MDGCTRIKDGWLHEIQTWMVIIHYKRIVTPQNLAIFKTFKNVYKIGPQMAISKTCYQNKYNLGVNNHNIKYIVAD